MTSTSVIDIGLYIYIYIYIYKTYAYGKGAGSMRSVTRPITKHANSLFLRRRLAGSLFQGCVDRKFHKRHKRLLDTPRNFVFFPPTLRSTDHLGQRLRACVSE